jgi:hypothetical protein
MVNSLMKKHYNIPNTVVESFRTSYICQAVVGSVQGNLNLHFTDIDEDPI